MSGSDLWKKYCSFYEKLFSEQFEYNKQRMNEYFEKWKKTDLAKMMCKDTPQSCIDAPITTYNDYPMLTEFGQKITEVTEKNPRRSDELLGDYYMRVSRQAGSMFDKFMVEPFHFCARTTGTTGSSKWVIAGETYWQNFVSSINSTILIACSDGWGESKLKEGDTGLNITAPVPFMSGWGARAYQAHFRLLPPLEITDNLENMSKKFYLVLKLMGEGKKIDVGGSVGSMFYMMCKYFVDPEEFYEEYYHSMNFSLTKILLSIKLVQCKLSRKEKKNIKDFMPLKGVIVGGMDSKLYIYFFREEYGIEPLHAYGATEASILMRGDPDRKTDLIPDLITSYMEFQTENGEVFDLDEVKKDEVYDLIVTPHGSILFRYAMGDLFRVVNFRDDGMPIFSFEGRKQNIIDIMGYFRVTPQIIVQALSLAGLRVSDKWAVAKLLEPQEHLCFLMEKT
jgi:hypothetical protein